jgi:2-polyprenyl-3-methyl-5-hydroxy-6-metoxy-1,4-benzoquinol methylase
VLAELIDAGEEGTVLDVGCGDLEVASALRVDRYVGIDSAASTIEIARGKRPDWRFYVADVGDPNLEIEPAQTVICLDVLIHQPTRERYEAIVKRLVALAQSSLIVAGYDDQPVHKSNITYFYEPLSETLERIGGFDELMAVGGYRDETILVGRRNAGTSHPRDMQGRDVSLMSHLVDDPLLFRMMLDLARSTIGFFPAHNPRAIEYTWIGRRLGPAVKNLSVLDVGAGVNPLPLWLARNEAKVVTVDSHPIVRDRTDRERWNEWGFLDYSGLDSRIRSIHAPFESLKPERGFDVLYSVSVIEHLSSKDRGAWMSRFAEHLRPGGRLLLTVDLVPWSDALWPYREGVLVEEPGIHGSLRTLVEELTSFGFLIASIDAKTHVPKSRVGLGLIEAQLRDRG